MKARSFSNYGVRSTNRSPIFARFSVVFERNEVKAVSMGIKSVSLNNVDDASVRRNWRNFAELGYILIADAKTLYADDEWDVDVEAPVFALDSTTRTLFNWASFLKTKTAIKVQTLLNVKSEIPDLFVVFLRIKYTVNILDELILSKKSYYVMDKDHNDFGRLHRIEKANASFVIRARTNT